MIYEIRTYTLKPRSMAEVEKRWAECYHVRQKYSAASAFLKIEFGPLNEFIHIWPYESLEERARVRAEAAKETDWPPPIQEFILNMQVEILTPFSFAPAWEPGKLASVYELRQYTFQPGALPDIQEKWGAALPERLKFSPVAMLGSIEFGPTTNSFIHLWPYESLSQREEIRRQAAATGKWPASVVQPYLAQRNKILVPAAQ
ncbi:MAG: NIPSNAP family protein [Chloroflexi bacterium]|nr:NIPSNAP family protein [Chloroflexota bacterium]MQC17395.1 hypothetical protein [Chloroflexota bacterium]